MNEYPLRSPLGGWDPGGGGGAQDLMEVVLSTDGMDGGGGRAAAPDAELLQVTEFSTSSASAIAVQNSLRWLKQATPLDETCNKWLPNNQLVIDQLLGDAPGTTNIVGVGKCSDPTVNAVAGVVGTNLAPGTAGITVNLSGAYFRSDSSAGSGTNIKAGSDAAQAFILLNELAHLTGAGGFLDNDRNEAAQTQNNRLLLENCGRTVSRAEGLP